MCREDFFVAFVLRMAHLRDRVFVAGGRCIFDQFCNDTGLVQCNSVSLYDHPNVVDQMSKNTAIEVGVDLDHLVDHCSFLLSYGFSHRRDAFDDCRTCYPMIELLDGYIFTDIRHNQSSVVHVYQDSWMREICKRCIVIGVRGDKGQVAQLLNKPAIIFDDREDNVRQVIAARHGNEGVHVRLRRRFEHEWTHQDQCLFKVSESCAEWPIMSMQFRDSHT